MSRFFVEKRYLRLTFLWRAEAVYDIGKRSVPVCDAIAKVCEHAFSLPSVYKRPSGHHVVNAWLCNGGAGVTGLPRPSVRALRGDPRRQAVATIEAYDYQMWSTLEQWLKLGPDEILYLEGAEDFDVCGLERSQTSQVKCSPTDISLASKDVQEAIHNYWKLVQDNPDVPGLKLRFLTRGGVRPERQACFGGRKGLDVWASAAAGSDEDALLLGRALPALLKRQGSSLGAFLADAPADVLRERVFTRIEWVVNQPHIDQTIAIVERMILKYGQSLGYLPDRARAAIPHLIRHCYQTVRLARPELRGLTQADLRDQFLDATAIKVPFNADVAKLLAQDLAGKAAPGVRFTGLRKWFAARPRLIRRRRYRQASSWCIDPPGPAYEAALSSLATARLALCDMGPVCFQGRQCDAAVPALCLWAESTSRQRVPGLVLVDTNASALQDTGLWRGALELGLDAFLHECRYVDVRGENIAIALGTTARDWRNSLMSALPQAVHERLERSGFAHLLEQTIDAMAALRHRGETAPVSGWAVDQALFFLCMPKPALPPQLCRGNRNGNDNDVSLRLDYESYMERQCPADVEQLAKLRVQLAAKRIDLGPVFAQESQHRSAIVLFDSAQPASLVLASVIHSLYYWRYVGWELRDRGIHTRPILYFSDIADVPAAQFIVESSAANTCIVNGPAPGNRDQWPDNKLDRAHLVQVEGDSFVYAGRRLQFTPA